MLASVGHYSDKIIKGEKRRDYRQDAKAAKTQMRKVYSKETTDHSAGVLAFLASWR